MEGPSQMLNVMSEIEECKKLPSLISEIRERKSEVNERLKELS
jgi:hypothetical protein